MNELDLESAIAAIKPTSKAAKIRNLMPAIEKKLQEGVKIAEILVVLQQGGLEVNLATFNSYLYRYRKNNGNRSTKLASPEKPQPIPAFVDNVLPEQITEPAPEPASLSKKQQREQLADQFIKPNNTTSPLLKRLIKEQSNK